VKGKWHWASNDPTGNLDGNALGVSGQQGTKYSDVKMETGDKTQVLYLLVEVN